MSNDRHGYDSKAVERDSGALCTHTGLRCPYWRVLTRDTGVCLYGGLCPWQMPEREVGEDLDPSTQRYIHSLRERGEHG